MTELNDAGIEELRLILLESRSALQETLTQIEQSSQAVELDQQAFGRVSRVDALQQQSMAKANQSQSQQLLREIMKALARIDSGDYGYCIDCDSNIGLPRLKARPETPRCLKCQSLQEQN